MNAHATPDVRHNEAARRFEVEIDGRLARLDYDRDGDVLHVYHTEVPAALAGRGIAATMVRAALAHADANGLRIHPACSYVRTYMRRHPETNRLLPDGVVP
jgi:predicted GNAT family acetyltransferase